MSFLNSTSLYAIVLLISCFTFRLINLIHYVTTRVITLGELPRLQNKRLALYIYQARFFLEYYRRPLLQLFYIGGNALCLFWHQPSLAECGARAGTLGLINLVVLLSGPHLSFLADLLGMSLFSYRLLHRSAAVMSLVLVIAHTAISLFINKTYLGDLSKPQYALLAMLVYYGQMLIPWIQKLPFEFMLRLHQALSIPLAYSIWYHIPPVGLFPRSYIYIAAGFFSITCVAQLFTLFLQNHLGFGTAQVSYNGDIIEMKLSLKRGITVEAGQYINLWIPFTIRSRVQTHPFMISSWSKGAAKELQLLIKPQRGLTLDLATFCEAKTGEPVRKVRNVVFTGPHGKKQLDIGVHRQVYLIAEGFGIVNHLPYLQERLSCLKTKDGNTNMGYKTHIIWQAPAYQISALVAHVNNILIQDEERTIKFDIFSPYSNAEATEMGEHQRFNFQPVAAPFEALLRSVRKSNEDLPTDTADVIAVIVSVSSRLRNIISQDLWKEQLHGVKLVALDQYEGIGLR